MTRFSTLGDWVGRMKDDRSWNMFLDTLCTAASGAVFGAALTAAGVHPPEIIIDQFRLVDFHMFKVFSVALGSSA